MIHIQSPVLLDLNTQQDLFAKDSTSGLYPLVNAAQLLDPLKRVFQWANRNKIPVVSTRLRNLIAPLPSGIRIGTTGGAPKLICNPHDTGYQKLPITLLRKRLEMPRDCGTDLPIDGFRTVQQLLFDLPKMNPFESPRLDRLLSESEVGIWLLIGAPLEWTIRTAVLGLLQRRQKVAIVSDAVGKWDSYEGDMALRQIESKNIEWLTSQQLVERFAKMPPARSAVTRIPMSNPAQSSQPASLVDAGGAGGAGGVGGRERAAGGGRGTTGAATRTNGSLAAPLKKGQPGKRTTKAPSKQYR